MTLLLKFWSVLPPKGGAAAISRTHSVRRWRGIIAFLLSLSLFCAVASRAATFTWNGGGADNNWSTAANWAGGVAPANDGTAVIVFAGISQLSPNVDVAWDINSLTFNTTAGAFVLGGSRLTVRGGGIVNSNANTQIINNAVTLRTNQTWSATAGKLTFAGNIDTGTGTNLLTITGNSNSLISGIISGAGGLTKIGTGTNILTGANTYSGITTVSAGVLNIQNSAALGSTNGGTVVASGATLQLQGGISINNEPLSLNGTGVSALGALRSLSGDNSWGGVITLAAAATIGCDTNNLTLGAGGISNSTFLTTFTGVGNINVTGSIGNGTGGVTKSGTGTLTLSGINSYGGLTTVSAGVLSVQNSSALGTTAAGTTVSSGAALQLQGGVDVAGETLSLSGTGISTSGAFRSISGSNSWGGTITLAAASTVNADTGTLFIGANIVNSTLLITFTNNGTILLSGALGSGTGGLTKNGTGMLVVNGANTYTGATTISGGILQFGAAGNLPSASAITVNTGGTLALNNFNESILSLAGAGSVTLGSGMLTVNNGAATTFSGVMSGSGGLIKAGTATFTMSGVNTYTGGTTINGGAISIAAATGLGNATNSLTLNGGTLTTSATLASARPITLGANGGVINAGGTTLTLSGTISGPGFLTKVGTKALTLTGTNTYLGGTTNCAGTITIGSDAALGDASGFLAFSNSATLTTTASFSSARNVAINAGTATLNTGTGFTNAFNGVISGAGAVTKSGTGVLLLNGSSTFTNLLTISAGTLRLGANERISDLAPVLIAATSATFDLNGFNETIGSLASSAAGKVTLSNGFLTAGGNNLSRTNSAVISGSGGFTKAGTGALIFTGANTYTNTTTVAAGTLQIGASERIANTSPLVVSNGATFSLTWNGTNYSETVASLSGGGDVILGTGTLTVGNAGTANSSGNISGAGAFTKIGTGTQIFSGTNSFTGATTISAGNLQVNGSSSNSPVTIASAATLSGNGTVGTVVVNSGATNSPGAVGAGTLGSSSQTWAGGGKYLWEINNATGAKGASSGWDWLNISGALTINANSGSKFTIKIVSLNPANTAGPLTNFDNTVTYIWTVASASGGISGFDATKFTLDTSGFQNSLGAGAFTLSQAGNDLNLVFTTAAQAVVKGMQSGTLTSSGNGTNTVTLPTAVNPTNAFLIFNTRHNSSVPGGSMIRGRLASSNSVEFVRTTAETSTMNIQWYVIEYSAGVRVQRGEVSQTNTIINIPLTPVSATNQAFVTLSKTPELTAVAFDDSDPVVAEITAATNLQLRVGALPNLPVSYPTIWWQVIEFTHPASLGVQTGSITNMTGTNTLASVTLNSPVDPNNTFLLTSYRTSGSGTSVGARLLRAQLSGSSTITVDRSIAGDPDDITEIFWQAVQFKDGSSVQSGSASFASGVAQTNIALISMNTNRAAAFASVQPVGGQNTGRSPSTGSVLGVGSATLALTSSSQLTLDRNNTSSSADVGWYVVGFGPGSLLTPAIGGTSISADSKGGAYTNLTGPIYTEIQNGNVGTGTIILKAPAGFIFDTNVTLPTVLITRVSGGGANSLNINGVASGTSVAMTTITTNALTFTVTSASSGGVTCSLTWQNVRMRPIVGTPLASGNLVNTGTAAIQGVVSNATSFGLLTEVVGAATKLALQTSPSSTAVAGVEFAQQPVIQIQDQFGNMRSGDGSTVVTAGINTGTGALQGSTTVTVIGGVATFSGLNYQIAETIKLSFSVAGLTGINSGNIAVSPAPASQLTIQTQPSATATAGVAFARQPVVRVEDQFGNLRSTDNGTVVSASTDLGSDDLFGTVTATAVGGVATFANLSYQVAETITIDFTSGSLDPDTSSSVTVNPNSLDHFAFAPIADQTARSPFEITIIAQDFYDNTATNFSGTVNLSTTASSISPTVSGAFSAGVRTENVSVTQTGSGKMITATRTGHAETGTSSSFTVNPGAAANLKWSAAVNGDWDVGLTANWLNLATGTPDLFYAGDDVRFDDSAAGPTVVNLATTVMPGAIVVSNATKNYTFTGLGKISGAADLIKQGSGALTNDTGGSPGYSGTTTNASGALVLGPNGSVASSPTISVASNALFDVSAVSGFSLASGQTLRGAGTVTGAVQVTSGATISPGNSIGTLTLSDSPLLEGTLEMGIDKSGVTLTSDKLVVSGHPLTYGGTLTVTATGDTLTGGEIFDLFDASSFSGSFTATNLPALGSGLNWWLGNLTVNGTIAVNRAPAATADTVTRRGTSALRIAITNLLGNDTDADGDLLSIASVSSPTAAGATVTLSGSLINYAPPPGFTNGDSFTYILRDTRGGVATGVVTVAMFNDTAQSQNLVIASLGGGSFRISFWGIPGRSYTVQCTTNIVTPNWIWLTNLTAGSVGTYELIDTPPPNTPSRFYRSVYP